jgi:hypothetical protein
MRSMFRLLMVVALVTLVSCKNSPFREPLNLPANIQIGSSYYTQFALKFEKASYSTANYRVGVLLPINSKVQLLEINNKIIRVQVEKFAHELLIKHHKKYTGGDTVVAFNQIFGTSKVSLKQFSKKERAQIEKGGVVKGMRKKAVLAAIGPPPKHGTPSTKYDEWMYWESKWNRFLVRFKNDKVVEVKE